MSTLGERRVMRIMARSGPSHEGFVEMGGRRLACVLGRAGRLVLKREGDGATPVGRFLLRRVLYRADRVARPRTLLPVSMIRPGDAWCDVSGDRNYNRLVALPYPGITETLWRDDHLYDLIVIIGHNEVPRKTGFGSAVFMHLLRHDRSPTQGCIAFEEAALRRLLRCAGPGDVIDVPA